MRLNDCCVLLNVRCELLIVRCLLCLVCRLPFDACWQIRVVLGNNWLPFGCVLFDVVCCLLCAVCFVACFSLCVVCCLIFVV